MRDRPRSVRRLLWIGKCLAALVLLATNAVVTGRLDAETGPASEIIVPRSGLALAGIGRRSGGIEDYDPMQSLFVRNGLADFHPQAGQTVTLSDGEERSWQAVEFDESGEIDRRAFGRGGYLFLPVTSARQRVMILSASGHGSLYFNGVPHTGNVYGYDYYHVPVLVREGTNSLLLQASRGTPKAELYAPPAPTFLLEGDQTLPDLLVGEPTDTWGAAIVVNATQQPVSDLSMVVSGDGLTRTVTELPTVGPLSIRKVGFRVQGTAPDAEGTVVGQLELRGTQPIAIHEIPLELRVRSPEAAHKKTFVSDIDGSVQYYALRLATRRSPDDPSPAIVLSCHGASVEAMGQASAYSPKSWLHLAAPTNRRPYGFDWEDFGRADAMEVLDIAKRTLRHDPSRIYLTGHSMGGHGAWHLGSLYPDTFAAIGPSAGWISYRSYARRGRGEAAEESPLRNLLRRGESIGDPTTLAENLKHHGVYVLHGADDNNVPAGQAEQMAELLGGTHRDWSIHQEPGKGHWWSNEWDDGGATCMDWPEMYDMFARHALPPTESVRTVEFATANPGVSSRCDWLAIEGQFRQHEVSRVKIHTWPNKRRFAGTTENVAVLRLDTRHLMSHEPITIELDGQTLADVEYPAAANELWLRRGDQWQVADKPSRSHKGSHRYGAIKDELQHRFLLVYGTAGSQEENNWTFAKARLDAEAFWYRGNASPDVVADADFDPLEYADRTIVLYGNADSNSAWSKLLPSSPVQVRRDRVTVGDRTLEGEDLAAMFVQPRQDSDAASVIAIAGTGATAMRLACKQSLFVPFTRYPDCIVLGADEIETGQATVRLAGYFGLDWSAAAGELIFGEP